MDVLHPLRRVRRRTRRPAATALGVLAVGALAVTLLAPGPTASGAPAPQAAPAAAAAEPQPVTDPVPDAVRSSLGLVVEPYHRFPNSQPTPAPTDARLMRPNRINYIGELPDGSGRQYVPDLNGNLYLLGEDGRRYRYLDVKGEFARFFSGRGLGSGFGFVAFHPEFESNGLLYTVHTEQSADLASVPTSYPSQSPLFSHSVITEWTARNPAANRFRGTHREVMRLGYASQIHAVQQIDFNPTARPRDPDYGLLYVASGDGGIGLSTDIPQQLDNPYGKLLRIDPDGRNGPRGGYGIPDDNPFVGDDGALGEIYSYGYRDPHRFSWDARTGRLYLGNIGQHAVEAVYEVRAGDNAGWSDIEGRYGYTSADECSLFTLTPEQRAAGYVFPVASFDHEVPAGFSCNADSGHAMSGGLVYRGRDLPALRGTYVFGDLVDGTVLWAEAAQMRSGLRNEAVVHQMQVWDTEGRRLSMQDLVGDERVDLRFGTDAEGELYFITKADGQVWKVVDTRRDAWRPEIAPSLADDVVSFYDFEHPFAVDGARELDQGASGQLLSLVNGGYDMRVRDGAYPGSVSSIQTQQVDPTVNGNDDWKAGAWGADGLPSLERFAGAEAATVMGWFKVTDGDLPALNSTTPAPDDRFNAVGLAGVLAGNSDGHGVRALLEIIDVGGTQRLVALGRRLDEGSSSTFAADADWRELLPVGEWVHLAATFDYTTGEMALYKNGRPLSGFYTSTGDPWAVDGSGTSDTLPRGYKIGGSFPQDTLERNPCECRMDALMFLDTAATRQQVAQQYRRFVGR